MEKEVLMIDDEFIYVSVTKKTLEKYGLKVHTLSRQVPVAELMDDVHESLRLNPNIAVVLLDIMMHTKEDGYHICREIKQHYRDKRVIMLTNLKSQKARDDSKLAGADQFVTKPFIWHHLHALIGREMFREDDESGGLLRSNLHHTVWLKEDNSIAIIDGYIYSLTLKSGVILRMLLETVKKNPLNQWGTVCEREAISSRLLEDANRHCNDRTVDREIVTLKKELGKHRECIKTITGEGYAFSF